MVNSFLGLAKCISMWWRRRGVTVAKSTESLLEKRGQGRVLCVLTAIFVTMTRWNCTVSWLSTNKGQVAVSFRKLKCLSKVVVVMKRSVPLCFSHRFESPTIQLSHGKKLFCHQVPICRFTITCIPAFQSSIKTHLGHSEEFYEKGCQGRLFCKCWISYLWLSCLGEAECYMNYQ